MGLLGLCYLTTSPDQSQAVAIIRLMTVTSMLDTGIRCLTSQGHHSGHTASSHGDQQLVDMVTGLCNLVKSVLVFTMASNIFNTVLRYENI